MSISRLHFAEHIDMKAKKDNSMSAFAPVQTEVSVQTAALWLKAAHQDFAAQVWRKRGNSKVYLPNISDAIMKVQFMKTEFQSNEKAANHEV